MNRLRWRWPVVLVTFLALALFLHLAQWQWRKAQAVDVAYAAYGQRVKEAPQLLSGQVLDAAQAQYLPFQVEGEYDAQNQFYLDNQLAQGVPGLQVITPLHIAGTPVVVLVNRGWLAWTDRTAPLPQVPVPSGRVHVQGLASVPSEKKFLGMTDPTTAVGERLRMRIDLNAFSQQMGVRVMPFVLLQNQDNANDPLVRQWSAPENKAGMHRSYAVQWLLISFALVVGVVWSGWRQNKNEMKENKS